jgi:hypothetical protein
MENRLENRKPHCIDLMYGANDTYSPGTALNLSPHGMLIHADSQMVPINREIKLVLVLEQEVISMRGVVCWNSEILDMQPEADKRLGVFIPDPHPEYVQFIDRLN